MIKPAVIILNRTGHRQNGDIAKCFLTIQANHTKGLLPDSLPTSRKS